MVLLNDEMCLPRRRPYSPVNCREKNRLHGRCAERHGDAYEFLAGHEGQLLEDAVEVQIGVVAQPFSSAGVRFGQVLFVEGGVLHLALDLPKFGCDRVVVRVV